MRVSTYCAHEPLLDHNHFHTCHPRHGAYMFVSEFKNVKLMGTFFNKELPQELVDVVRLSVRRRPRAYLFVDPATGSAFARVNAFTKYSNGMLKRLFDNPGMSVNALRHAHAVACAQ